MHNPSASAYPVLHVVHVAASPVHTEQPVLSEGVHAEKYAKLFSRNIHVHYCTSYACIMSGVTAIENNCV